MDGRALAGLAVLVAGGTGNVGSHLTRQLLLAGARVVVPSRSRARLAQLRRTLPESLGERLIGFEGEVADPNGAVRVREEAERLAGGPMNAVVATLGGFVGAPSVLSAPLEDLERAVQGYLYAHFVVARTFLPSLAQIGGAYVSINGPLAWNFTSVTAGGGHTCGVTAEGTAYCWGNNTDGELGDGTQADHLTPEPVLGDLSFTSLSAGFTYTCGVTTEGDAYCWGFNASGRLGGDTPKRAFNRARASWRAA